MKLAKFLSIITTILLLCLLCSCAKGGSDLKDKLSPLDKSLIDLASGIYEDSQLLEIVKHNGSINELNAQYPIECLRENEGTYRASYLGDASIAVIMFDNSGNRILGGVHSTQLLRSDFSCLENGQSLENVREIDPNGEYLFLYTGRSDTPKVSTHYTKDGYLITIEYNNSNTIINIKEELI